MMPTTWLEDYVRLAFGIERVFQTLLGRRLVAYYYGPAEWSVEEKSVPARPPAELLRVAGTLDEALAT
jgi:hypothetical protein